MKKNLFSLAIFLCSSLVLFAHSEPTKIFTLFTSHGCGCTGSGGAPLTFTTNEEVISELEQACKGVDFIVWDGTRKAALVEMQLKKSSYDGVLIIGGIDGDYRLAFNGLPTIAVYNLWENQTDNLIKNRYFFIRQQYPAFALHRDWD